MSTTDAPLAATESTTTTVDPELVCAACPHGREAHDRIGTRFCSATIAGGLSRGCVCVGEALLN
jgi:hypothetical protein